MKIARLLAGILLLSISFSFAQNTYPSIGKVIRNSPQLDALLATDAKIEVLASGFIWTEGPVRVKDGG